MLRKNLSEDIILIYFLNNLFPDFVDLKDIVGSEEIL